MAQVGEVFAGKKVEDPNYLRAKGMLKMLNLSVSGAHGADTC